MKTSKALRTAVGLLVCCSFSDSSLTKTWYVKGSVAQSGDGQTWESAFRMIGEGIDAASHGDVIVVAEGTYVENVSFEGKNIVLRSTNPLDPVVVAKTIIQGDQNRPVVSFSGTENETCEITGFTIMSGRPGILGGTYDSQSHAGIRNNVLRENAEENGGGVSFCDGVIENNTIANNWAGICGAGLYDCDGIIMNNRIVDNTSAECAGGLGNCNGTIQNNLIAGNSGGEAGGGLYRCHGTILNNTIVDNSGGLGGGGLYGCYGSIINCIICGNNNGEPDGQIRESNTPSFSSIQNWTGGGRGNISDDPRFVDPEAGDYHLRGDSPCIGTGVNFYWFVWPQRDLDGNCRLSGKRVDLGCYEHGSSPDRDGDLLPDQEEMSLAPNSTNPNKDDTDDDGLRDGLEVLRGSDPVMATPPRAVSVPSDIPTIQEALCLAVKGDVISVRQGTYHENVQFCGTDVVLQNYQYGNPNWWWYLGEVVVDGGGAGPVISFEGSESAACLIAGLTIQNGRAHTGGGIRGGTRGRHTHATIRDNEIMSNSAAGYGASGAGIGRCDGDIQNNAISSNSGEEGGCGVAYCDGTIQGNTIQGNSGGGLWFCNGTIEQNSISGNSGSGLYQCHGTIRINAIADNKGSGLWQCHGTIEGNTISGNTAEGYGGGLSYCDGAILRNDIRGNSGYAGGGLALCNGIIHANIISENTGGGLAVCSGTIQNNVVSENFACDGAGLWECHGLILNNTIFGNASCSTGGGFSRCHGTMVNCIIWGNTAGREGNQIYDSNIPMYSCIQDWTGGGTGNTTRDPRFVDPMEGDFHLKEGSPCIDAGTNYYWVSWPQTDADGNCRLVGPRVDMGCFEYGASADADGDLLSDSDEETRRTDPNRADTDGDGLRDGLEVLRGSDPLTTTCPGTLRVPENVGTVQGALCLSRGGDEVVVAPGIYPENLYFCGHDVILRSSDPTNPSVVASTVLDAGGTGPVVSFTGDESAVCVFSGFTIRNGRSGIAIGGIIGGTQDTWTHATIENNVITANIGGMIYCDGLIRNNSVSDNSGGGIWECDGTIRSNVVSENSGIGVAYCDGLIEGNTVSANGDYGLSNCRATIRRNTISSNQRRGLFDCHGVIENNVISKNSDFDGAGMYDCSWLIQNNLIVENSAGRYGGGLFKCSGTIRNNIIAGNAAAELGGGLYDCYTQSSNNTIVGNSAGIAGGGLWDEVSWPALSSIFWGNTAPQDPQLHAPGPSDSCIQGWQGGGWDNISDDPLFADPDGLDDDPSTYGDNNYRLQAGSPCIDKGGNQTWMWETGDFDGNKRVANGIVDMGAFEFGAGPVAPPRLFVDPDANGTNDGTSWTDAFKDLRDALNLAAGSPGAVQEIWVAAGTYKPDRGTGDRGATFQLVDGAALYGGFAGGETDLSQRDPAANLTILSGDLNGDDGPDFANNSENSYHVVTGSGTDSSAVLDGFVITGGNADGGGPHYNGAGVFAEGGSPTLRNCTITGNTAEYCGSGVYNYENSNPMLANCTISGNRGRDYHDALGGGMYNYKSSPTLVNCTFNGNSGSSGGGMYNYYSNPRLTDCVFSGNSVHQGGGGMDISVSCPTLTNCVFSGNFSDWFGGGGMDISAGSSPVLTNCTFSGNSTPGYGGGIESTGTPTLTNCTITENRARSGGGICAEFGNPTLVSCLIGRNSSESDGAGMYFSGGSGTLIGCRFFENSTEIGGGGAVFVVGTAATPTFVNCVFSGNWADGRHSGGGVLLTDGGDVTLTNCTLTGNTTGGEGGGILGDGHFAITNCILWGNVDKNGTGESSQLYYGSMDVNYSCVQGWTGELGGEGNIGANPLFVNADGPDDIPGTEDDNVRLLCASPCLDTGNDAAVPPSALTDIAGNPRIVNGKVDMGAFEFQRGPWLIITREGDIATLEWGDFGSGSYTVEWRDDLMQGTWHPAAGNWPIGELMWSDILTKQMMQRFYRVESGGIYTDPVGFIRVLPVDAGLTLLSVPLAPADNRLNGEPGCIGDMLKEVLTGGANARDADMVFKWNARTQTYRRAYVVAGVNADFDGKWWDEETRSLSTMMFDVGECFWVLRRPRTETGP